MKPLILTLALLLPQAMADTDTAELTITVRLGEDTRQEQRDEIKTFCEDYLSEHLRDGD